MTLNNLENLPPGSPRFAKIVEMLSGHLKYLKKNGINGFDLPPDAVQKIARLSAAPAAKEDIENPKQEKNNHEKDIKKLIEECRDCRLSDENDSRVIEKGSPNAKLMVIGEAPGKKDIEAGAPFSGESGDLLNKIIKSINLEPADVFFCNVLKCRPQANRSPEASETAACMKWLVMQIKIVNPEFILTLGSTAAKSLLNTEKPLSAIKNRFHDYNGIMVLPTLHPALLLRNPGKKREVWEDMKLLMEAIAEKR